MFTRIELENFQSHKNTVIDFDKGITSLCGESDNGKSAVVRGIRWIVENRPLGTDKLNSNWNKDFKKPMRVRLYTDNGWVERIRTKDRNGYTICLNNKEPVELSAVGTDVPPEVTEFLKVSDVNFQFQLDQPYLLCMTPGDATKYLNDIVHLDSIDKMLSAAESNKRSVSAEQKVVDKDISDLEKEIEDTAWVEDAQKLARRIEVYENTIKEKSAIVSELADEIETRKSLITYDMSKAKKLVEEIEGIELPDVSELTGEIESYQNSSKRIVDLSAQKKLVEEIEGIELPDVSELTKEINDYKLLKERILILKNEGNTLKGQLPDVCPVCGGKLKEGASVCF